MQYKNILGHLQTLLHRPRSNDVRLKLLKYENNILGMVKFLADSKIDEILSVHTVGTMASELISEAMVVAVEFRASAEDIASIYHAQPHPCPKQLKKRRWQ